ncbi:scavenger receptor class F member 1-like [Littorina saxatilis]|uniref:scavenger receptor class F member 1-like n=1 Tax=Littorina saxatilis TaxID=31220 RepID=UPI0038B463FF
MYYLGSCLPGWYGRTCNTNCLSPNCLLNTCDQGLGRCLACNTGYAGDTCTGCAPGYYRVGVECQQCSSGCKDNKCDDNTGKCDGCQPGYQGDQCTSPCSSRCTQCSQDGTCTVCNGQFMTPSCTECVEGLSKHNTTTCSPCSAFCSTGGCDKVSGNCNGACQAGRWGGQCEKSCPVNCEPHTCDRYTGKCEGCRPGYHGQQCDESCSTIAGQCVQCNQSGWQCTACSGHFQLPQCTGTRAALIVQTYQSCLCSRAC